MVDGEWEYRTQRRKGGVIYDICSKYFCQYCKVKSDIEELIQKAGASQFGFRISG